MMKPTSDLEQGNNMSKCARRECQHTSSSRIKCKDCSSVFYCSIRCLGDDWEELHSYECEIRSGIRLRDLLETTTKLETGKFGEVKKVAHYETGENFALEEISKSQISHQKLRNSLKNYVSMRKTVDHQHIVSFLGELKDKHSYYLLFSLPPALTLRNLIQARTLSEDQARRIFEKLCRAVQQLHSQGIPHRNIKTELIRIDNEQNPIICDHTWDPDWLPNSSSARDWDYMAPEFIEGFPIRTQIDLWGLGIVLFELTHGFGPFEAVKKNRKKRHIMGLNFKLAEIDYNAQDLISKLLVINPEDRITIEEVLEHPFVTAEEIEVKTGTTFYLNDKQCGIIKGTVIAVMLSTCRVKYEEINKDEQMSLQKVKKLIHKSKYVEMKHSRKLKKADVKISLGTPSQDKSGFTKQNSQQLYPPPSCEIDQFKPSGIDIVRNAIASSKNLQSNYYLYGNDEDPNQKKVPRINSFYTKDEDEYDQEDTGSTKKFNLDCSRDDDNYYALERWLNSKSADFDTCSSKDKYSDPVKSKLNKKPPGFHSFYNQDDYQLEGKNSQMSSDLDPVYNQGIDSFLAESKPSKNSPAIHSFYSQEIDDDLQTKDKYTKMPSDLQPYYYSQEIDNFLGQSKFGRNYPAPHSFYSQEIDTDYLSQNKSSDKVPVLNSSYTRDLNCGYPRGVSNLGLSKISQNQLTRPDVISLKVPQERIANKKKVRHSDKLFMDYKGEGDKSRDFDPEFSEKNNRTKFRRVISNIN